MSACPVGDVARGQKIFQSRCAQCHTVDQGGPNKLGPNLYGIFGRSAGALPNYQYSEANKNSGVTWNEGTLFEYLLNPKQFIPTTKMPFAGLKSEQDRADCIAFLQKASTGEIKIQPQSGPRPEFPATKPASIALISNILLGIGVGCGVAFSAEITPENLIANPKSAFLAIGAGLAAHYIVQILHRGINTILAPKINKPPSALLLRNAARAAAFGLGCFIGGFNPVTVIVSSFTGNLPAIASTLSMFTGLLISKKAQGVPVYDIIRRNHRGVMMNAGAMLGMMAISFFTKSPQNIAAKQLLGAGLPATLTVGSVIVGACSGLGVILNGSFTGIGEIFGSVVLNNENQRERRRFLFFNGLMMAGAIAQYYFGIDLSSHQVDLQHVTAKHILGGFLCGLAL